MRGHRHESIDSSHSSEALLAPKGHANPATAIQSSVLNWNFQFLDLDERTWIAFDPALGCALRVNRRAKDLIECLKGSVSLEAALHGFSTHQPTSTIECFANDVARLTDVVESSRRNARRRMLFGITLVPHQLFSKCSDAFVGLINGPALLINLLLFAVVLPIALLQLNPLSNSNGHMTETAEFFLVIASVIVHELGHGAALRRFGHGTGGLGLGLYLIYPVFYVEMLTLEALPKHGRVWVDVAGSHMQTLFGHVIALIGLVLGIPWLVSLAIGIYAIAAFQLLPVNRSDGFWMLLDALEGVLHPRHIRWVRYACHTLAGAMFLTIMVVSLHHFWRRFEANSLAWASLGIESLIGLAQIAVLFVLLFRFIIRRRRMEMG